MIEGVGQRDLEESEEEEEEPEGEEEEDFKQVEEEVFFCVGSLTLITVGDPPDFENTSLPPSFSPFSSFSLFSSCIFNDFVQSSMSWVDCRMELCRSAAIMAYKTEK